MTKTITDELAAAMRSIYSEADDYDPMGKARQLRDAVMFTVEEALAAYDATKAEPCSNALIKELSEREEHHGYVTLERRELTALLHMARAGLNVAEPATVSHAQVEAANSAYHAADEFPWGDLPLREDERNQLNEMMRAALEAAAKVRCS